MSRSTACPLCAGTDSTPVGHRDRDGRPLLSVLCRTCGLVRVDPLPSREELDAWYAQSYRLDYKGVVEPRPHHVLRAGRVALDRIRRIRPLLAGRPRTLDVGSGGGEMVYLMTRVAGARAEGLEPNRGYAGHARERLGLTIHEGFVERADAIPDRFDLITLFHVLEHLAEPAATLRLLRDRLRPGGHLVIEVPNVEATCQAPAHTYHRAHLTLWGIPTLERLGLQAGLRPVSARRSPDGGNIEVTFLRDEHFAVPDETVRAHTDGYAGHVARVLEGHTPWRHYLSGRPLARLARRLGRQAAERAAVLGAESPRAILDALVEKARSDE
ncbi:MAG: class I SAM-dependent methyltransferase, partial [Vicinamibacterales bacterium]|nr:class I SAM-dependent methyltransferase [Vicinamibacterales bacterium]